MPERPPAEPADDAATDDYFQAIERHFGRRRGGPLVLSPRDWQLVERWHRRGFPLEVVLRGINRAFDLHAASRPRPDRINSLRYCRQQVEEAWQEYRESRSAEGGADTESSPFASTAEHLGRAARACTDAAAGVAEDDAARLLEAARSLEALAERALSGQLSVRDLDRAAQRIEDRLLAGLRGARPALPRFSPWA